MFKQKKNNWVIGNWKLNPTLENAKELFGMVALEYANRRDDLQNCQVAIAPPQPYLAYFSHQENKLPLVSQDISIVSGFGAYTGETSAELLIDLGVSQVLIGHSERRELFGDDVVRVQQKIKNALKAGLTVVYCVGESLLQRESGQAKEVVLQQVKELAEVVETQQWVNILIAYEPIWAIGTGKTASPQDAQDMHATIREALAQYTAMSDEIALLYGGSVKPENAVELAACADINGALVGGASLDATSFISIIQAFAQSK